MKAFGKPMIDKEATEFQAAEDNALNERLEEAYQEKVTYKTALYEGKPMIVLTRSADDKYPFQFGYSKAKLIMDNIDKIQAFVQHEETVRSNNPNQYKKKIKKGTLK